MPKTLAKTEFSCFFTQVVHTIIEMTVAKHPNKIKRLLNWEVIKVRIINFEISISICC